MTHKIWILCLVHFLTSSVLSAYVYYYGFELLSVFARNMNDVIILSELDKRYNKLDFWIKPFPHSNATILVPPEFLGEFKDTVSNQGLLIVVLSDDVQSIIEAGNGQEIDDDVENKFRTSEQVIDHNNYHRYSKIQEFIKILKNKYRNIKLFYKNHRTFEGRRIAIVKLTGRRRRRKPAIIIEAGTHAREWISPAVNLWFIEKILQDYANEDSTARSMLDKYDWYIVPVANPDGYEYSHLTNRLWRKNRRADIDNCVGVDLNRNFDIMFGTSYSSSDCQSNIYHGSKAFSEPETANIRDLFNSLIKRVVAYVSVHSYSKLVLVPWGYTNHTSRPSNHVELDRVTKLMTAAMSERHGEVYQHGTAADFLFGAGGASEDWALSKKSGIIALCIELRPNKDDERGFILPPEEIIPTGEEFYASLAIIAKEIR